MSFLLMQILICLLIAGLIGAIIGWFLRGNCSKKLQELNEECEMKMRAVEREWNTKLHYSDNSEPHAYNNSLDAEDIAHADLKNQVQGDINPTHNKTLFGAVATALGVAGYGDEKLDSNASKELLSQKGIQLSDENNIDFKNSQNLKESYDIQTIEGVNSKYAQRFNELGIFTTMDLVNKLGNNDTNIDNVAKKLKVQSDDIVSWVSMADILRLPNVNAQDAQLIQQAGISSVRDLGAVNTYSFHREMVALNEKSKIVKEVPDIKSLQLWSKIAKLIG